MRFWPVSPCGQTVRYVAICGEKYVLTVTVKDLARTRMGRDTVKTRAYGLKAASRAGYLPRITMATRIDFSKGALSREKPTESFERYADRLDAYFGSAAGLAAARAHKPSAPYKRKKR